MNMNNILQLVVSKLKKSMIAMSIICVSIIFLSSVEARANDNFAKQALKENISLELKNTSISKILLEIKKQTGLGYSVSGEINNELSSITVKEKNKPVEEILNKVLSNTGYGYSIDNNSIIIVKDNSYKAPITLQQQEKITVHGIVVSDENEPIVGATIIVLDTNDGVITDNKGQFVVELVKGQSIEVSFVGYENQVLKFDNSVTDLTIRLKADDLKAKDVVVTGYFNKSKESFTGSVKTISGEELKQVSNTSVITAISLLTPGLNIVTDNEMGSNPNSIPDLVLRGTSSLITDEESSSNQPLIILDGIEISVTDLYDLDINEVESINVLKDASATALYGEKAANGVIVIERSAISSSPITATYNFTTSISFPDVSSYDFLNAAEKLDFEVLSGVYDFTTVAGLQDYNEKKIRVSEGIDTDWLRKAIRTGYTVNNSVGLSGRSGNLQYRLKANLNSTTGVMKEDSRTTKSVNAYLLYRVAEKIQFSYQSTYTQTNVVNTPYGTFSDYAKMNPYDSPYDEYGNVVSTLSFDITNPLYEATVGNFDNNRSSTYTNNVTLRYDFMPGLYITALGSISTTRYDAQVFTSPDSQSQADEEVNARGLLKNSYSDGTNYTGNYVLNYSTVFENDHTLSLHVGGDIYRSNSYSENYTLYGFMNNDLYYSNFATGYYDSTDPGGSNSLVARMGAFASGTYTIKNKYFAEGSLRYSGSSQFGSENKYAPFWSLGAGWNIHNEDFMKDSIFSTLRLRYSYGVTGSIAFSSYQAITTYEYDTSYYYWNGIGALPITMGNSDLKWQTTKQNNVGLNATFLDNRISLTLDYYRNITEDMLVSISIPSSVGVDAVMDNLGRMKNTGIEFDVTAALIQNKDWRLQLTFNGSHNRNEILEISSGLEKYNDENKDSTGTPNILYNEGESSTAIYAVRSYGINPYNGNEIFITADGDLTETYSADDKVVVGDWTPTLQGTIMPYLAYKNFSLSVAMSYTLGGQIYNSTRANNVENVNPYYNVDQRAYDERWKEIGDIVVYRDIGDYSSSSNVHSSRFVEDENTLQISRVEFGYEFQKKFLEKIGFKRLRVSAGMTDVARLSTVYYERGTTYPYARSFTFSINPTF